MRHSWEAVFLVISIVRNVSMILNEVFLHLEQNHKILVSLGLYGSVTSLIQSPGLIYLLGALRWNWLNLLIWLWVRQQRRIFPKCGTKVRPPWLKCIHQVKQQLSLVDPSQTHRIRSWNFQKRRTCVLHCCSWSLETVWKGFEVSQVEYESWRVTTWTLKHQNRKWWCRLPAAVDAVGASQSACCRSSE